jgi:hypothetical protein
VGVRVASVAVMMLTATRLLRLSGVAVLVVEPAFTG